MTNRKPDFSFTTLLETIIGVLLWAYLIIPNAYNFLHPIGFWQNFIMIFLIDLPSLFIVVEAIRMFLRNIFLEN